MKKQTNQEKSKALSTPVTTFATAPKTLFVATAAALVLVLAIYLLRLDHVVGLYGDDGWYALLAKALATGQGYTLINLPTNEIKPVYPPGFPFLLSLAWRLAPQFPQNLWLLKAVSIMAMFGVGLVAYYYFVREREQPKLIALGIAFITVSSPAFAFLATSTLMSECVFTLAQLAAICVLERSVRESKEGQLRAQALLWVLLGAALTSFALQVRSIAVGLVIAAAIYFLKNRLPKTAGVFVLAVVLFVLPFRNLTQAYSGAFWQRKASYLGEGYITLDELPTRVWQNSVHLLEYDFGALIVYPMYRAIEPSEGRLRYWWHDYTSLLLSVLIIGGYVLVARRRMTLAEIAIIFSLAITVMWPFRPFRFVLPLLPWLLFYLLESVRTGYGWLKRRAKTSVEENQWKVALSTLVLISAINVWSNFNYALSLHSDPLTQPQWVRMFAESEKLIGWMKNNVPADAVIAAQFPALVYLYTGHKGDLQPDPVVNWERWKTLGVRYLAFMFYAPLGTPPASEQRFKEVYRSPTSNFRVLDLGDPATRPDWPKP